MAQEYRLEEVLLALEDENVLDALLKQRGTFESFEYYLNNPSNVINEIIKKENYQQYIKGLISIYPLSENILKELMEKYDVSAMRDDIFDWLDTSNTIYRMVNKFLSLCSDSIAVSSDTSDLEDQINKLEKKKESLQVEMEKHEKNKKELYAKRQEVDKLKADCEEMGKRYSRERLEKEEEDYRRKHYKLIAEEKEFENRIQKLEKDLKAYSEKGNSKFDRAMKSLANIIGSLPEDEG